MTFLKKFALFGLTAVLLFAAVACGGGDEETPLVPDVITSDAEAHYVEDTLHKISVSDTGRAFITDAGSAYAVVAGGSAAAKVAANFIVTHLLNATGTELPLLEDAAWSQNAKYIVVGDEELFAAAGLAMPQENIGFTGYYIKSVGDSVFLAVNGEEGYQLAAIAFLREVIGYDMLSGDTVIYAKDGATLPDMEIIERPDFDYRQMSEPVGSVAQYGMGFTNNSIMMAINGNQWHNSFQYLPPEDYADEHPEWYTEDGRTQTSATNGQNQGQLCYSAHGDSEGTLQLMMETAYARLKEIVLANPELSNITFTQEDNYDACTCQWCTAEKEKYGGSANGPVIRFLNQLAEWLEEDLGSERRVTISFFAYRATEAAPAARNEDGSYSPIDGIHCHPNVGVIIAPITATYSHSFYESVNSSFADNIRAWSSVCDNIYMWLYETNFEHYLFPAGTWDTVAETYRFCKENNAVYMYNEGQWNSQNVSHFSKLKEYIDSRLMVNVNLNYAELVDTFFEEYYGEGGVYMREFFDGLQAHLKYLEQKYPAQVRGGYKDDIAVAAYWPKKLLDGWIALIDRAYAAIEELRTADPEQYAVYASHIRLESVFPRYALLSLHEGSYSAEELRTMRTSFRDDCVSMNVTMLNEQVSLDGVYTTWGL